MEISKETDREKIHDPFLSRTLSLSQMMLPLLGQDELQIDRAREGLLQRDARLGGGDALDAQHVVEDRPHEVLVVDAVELRLDVALPRNEVGLDDLGDLLQLRDRLLQQLRLLDRDVDVGADIVAEQLGIDDRIAAQNHAGFGQLVDALVDSRTRDAAFAGDLQVGHASVSDEVFEDLAVDGVQRHGFHRQS